MPYGVRPKVRLDGAITGSVFFCAYDSGTDSLTQNQKGNTDVVVGGQRQGQKIPEAH